jgi:hypothetical protein
MAVFDGTFHPGFDILSDIILSQLDFEPVTHSGDICAHYWNLLLRNIVQSAL